jgi:hypothetical protein
MPFDSLRLALDRSMRRYDEEGRMYVEVSHLTKACVNPYRGHEIPGYEQLGLDADRIYNLFRHPAELQVAVPTFNNIQILDQHIPVTAADDNRGRVIGSTGTDARWNAPYIDNSLVFWSDPAIAMIESGEMRELSSAYRYDPIMRPGVYMGQRYDGVMTNIRANHIALVEAGRAGSDVVVMDSKLKETSMKTLSPHAAWIAGSTVAYYRPLLAKDKKMPDMIPIFTGVTAKNWKQSRDRVEAAVIRTMKPLLAMDAEVHIHEHLDGAGAGAPPDAMPGDPAAGAGGDPTGGLAFGGAAAEGSGGAGGDPMADPNADPAAGGGGDDDLAAKVQQLLQGQIDDNDLAIILHALKQVKPPPAPAAPAKPAAAAPADPAAGGGGGDPPAKKKDDNGGGADTADCATDQDDVAEKLPGLAKKDTAAMDSNKPVTKAAMDAAIQKAVNDTTARLNAREEAARFVRPWVGEITMALDSATDVYKFALEQQGEDLADIHPSAFKALLSRIPKPNEAQAPRRMIAMDSDGNKQFLERFPNANRLQKH